MWKWIGRNWVTLNSLRCNTNGTRKESKRRIDDKSETDRIDVFSTSHNRLSEKQKEQLYNSLFRFHFGIWYWFIPDEFNSFFWQFLNHFVLICDTCEKAMKRKQSIYFLRSEESVKEHQLSFNVCEIRNLIWIIDQSQSYYIFRICHWCSIRPSSYNWLQIHFCLAVINDATQH